MALEIYLTGVLVDDQAKALDFYTKKLGFNLKHDIPVGEYRYLTVTSSVAPDGVELLLEPSAHPAVPPFKEALVRDGIPATSFRVRDLESVYEHLCNQGVVFVREPFTAGDTQLAILDDTCGNLIQLIQFED
ncbi:MAG: VOC family protein [Gammaproteobacteria bacterium]|nr:VOC family protein [Gammaproteobacteria bacterium]MYF37385.1 VOC family protein [Gammaproteobacteria bacterium]